MKYTAAKKLLDYLEQFEQQTGHNNLSSFAVWLTEKVSNKSTAELDEGQNIASLSNKSSLNGVLASAVNILYQHTKHYIKTALKDSPLVSIHDFVFLLSLEEQGDMRKKAIIDLNYLEFSPGMEVIRRLIRKDLIEEFDDPDDKRSKRIRITQLGKEVLKGSMSQINQASEVVSGNLSMQEKLQMVNLVQKLIHFHHPIWHDDFGSNLPDLMDKYLPPKE